jgi:hypothetical protein
MIDKAELESLPFHTHQREHIAHTSNNLGQRNISGGLFVRRKLMCTRNTEDIFKINFPKFYKSMTIQSIRIPKE